MSWGGSFLCSFALELQRERAFGAFSASRARFLSRSIIRRSHFRVLPIVYAIPDDFADGIEKRANAVVGNQSELQARYGKSEAAAIVKE
jgi:hypothetical protein